MRYFKVLKISLIGFVLFALCGFTNFSAEDKTLHKDIPGNPDSTVGIVFKLDSTANDILEASSSNIRFSAAIYFEGRPIQQLGVPIDFKPKKITLLNEKLGFTGEVFRPIIYFTETGVFEKIVMYPFDPSKFQTQEAVQPYLKKWIEVINQAGWRSETPKKNSGDNPDVFPIEETMRLKHNMVWVGVSENNHYKLFLTLERANPSTFGKDYIGAVYNLKVTITNDTYYKNFLKNWKLKNNKS